MFFFSESGVEFEWEVRDQSMSTFFRPKWSFAYFSHGLGSLHCYFFRALTVYYHHGLITLMVFGRSTLLSESMSLFYAHCVIVGTIFSWSMHCCWRWVDLFDQSSFIAFCCPGVLHKILPSPCSGCMSAMHAGIKSAWKKEILLAAKFSTYQCKLMPS